MKTSSFLQPKGTWGVFFHSLRVKLLLICLALAILPMAILGWVSYWEIQQALSSRITDDMALRSSILATEVRNTMDERMINLQFLAATREVQSMDPEAMGGMIEQYYKQYGHVHETIGVFGVDGNTVYSTDGGYFNLSERAYFQQTLKGETVFSDPVVSKSTGNVVFVVAVPIVNETKIVGVIVATIPSVILGNELTYGRIGETGEAYLINQDGYFITPSRFEDELKQANLIKNQAELELKVDTLGAEQALHGVTGYGKYKDYRGIDVLGAYTPIKNSTWGLLVEEDYAEAFASISSLRFLMLAIIAGAAILSGVVAAFAALGLARPILGMTKVARSLAKGEIEQNVTHQGKDEIGELADSFRAMIDYQTQMAESARQLANGDLRQNIQPASSQDTLGNAFAQMVVSLRDLLAQVSESAANLDTASSQLAIAANQAGDATNQIASTIQQVSSGINQQSVSSLHTATSMEQVSRAIDEVAKGTSQQVQVVTVAHNVTTQITASVQQVAGNAQSVTQDSATVTEAARNGAKIVEETIHSMKNIKSKVGLTAQKVSEMGKRSDQVGVIIETIDDIANQTNLLALNAAIEAARAGEHGKGFAVVADEVRKLAERVTIATKEIGELIKGVQNTAADAVSAMNEGVHDVEAGVLRANDAGTALTSILKAAEAVYQQAEQALKATDKMNHASHELASSMEAVSAVVEQNIAATEEMAASAGAVNRSIENIASVSEENSAAMEEVSATTEEMNAQVEEVSASAESLAEMAAALQKIVMRFKFNDESMGQGWSQQTEPDRAKPRAIQFPYAVATNGHRQKARI